jgi:hypothetical protein
MLRHITFRWNDEDAGLIGNQHLEEKSSQANNFTANDYI